jgi:RNA polymerase sigma-70 factor (sigma-E family)
MELDPDFGAYVRERRPALIRFALALTSNASDAEDLVQTALTRTALRWKSVRNRDNPDAYVKQAIVRQHINHWRRWTSRELPTGTMPERPSAPVDVETREVVWSALAGLPPRQRAVIVLRYYEDLSEAQIAQTLGCSQGTVKSQASKAMRHLRGMTGLRERESTVEGAG